MTCVLRLYRDGRRLAEQAAGEDAESDWEDGERRLREKLEHFCKVSKRREDHYLGGFGSGMKAAREICERHPDDYAGLLELPEENATWEAYDASLQETLKKRFRETGTDSEDRI